MTVAVRIALLILLVLAAFAIVAMDRRKRGEPVWSELTLLYALVAAAITMFLLKLFKIWP